MVPAEGAGLPGVDGLVRRINVLVNLYTSSSDGVAAGLLAVSPEPIAGFECHLDAEEKQRHLLHSAGHHVGFPDIS